MGDAAFALDPLSGSGILRALAMGVRAAEIIAAALQGKRGAPEWYQLSAGEQFAEQLRWRAYFYGLERRWPSSLFWSRRRG